MSDFAEIFAFDLDEDKFVVRYLSGYLSEDPSNCTFVKPDDRKLRNSVLKCLIDIQFLNFTNEVRDVNLTFRVFIRNSQDVMKVNRLPTSSRVCCNVRFLENLERAFSFSESDSDEALIDSLDTFVEIFENIPCDSCLEEGQKSGMIWNQETGGWSPGPDHNMRRFGSRDVDREEGIGVVEELDSGLLVPEPSYETHSGLFIPQSALRNIVDDQSEDEEKK